ncbi:unnamed protein product [Dracunculus medinensis]|uniref:DUF3752 domain-containing protein n=1 Tax=Dracunculus medinensis TaxID=318479 RepID=A0A0N4UBT8_DRAME|nr:unnamed protein product [Dracunculus medinensis]
MSSPQLPRECVPLQLPSWDEIDSAEMNCSGSECESESDQSSLDSSSRDEIEDLAGPSSVASIDTEHPSLDPSHLFIDHLPNSISDNISSFGCALPPTTLYGNNGSSDDDPEDPGDPEDPDGKVFPVFSCEMLYSHGPSVLPASYSSPSRHPSSNSTTSVNLHNNFSPSLPVEETKIEHGTTLPPPEPEETRTLLRSTNIHHSKDSKFVQTSIPELPISRHFAQSFLPSNESNSKNNYESAFGPTMPLDLYPQPSASSYPNEFDVEIPIESDEHHSVGESIDNIIGPIPPWEQNSEAMAKDYEDRFARYALCKTIEINRIKLKAPIKKREEWMLKPPTKLGRIAGCSSFSRSLSGNAANDEGIRNWTETPLEKAKRLGFVDCVSFLENSGKSQKLQDPKQKPSDASAEGTSSSGNISLLELHRRKRKLDDDKPMIRRPFDRERDLQINGPISNKYSSVIKEQLEELKSRFTISRSEFL